MKAAVGLAGAGLLALGVAGYVGTGTVLPGMVRAQVAPVAERPAGGKPVRDLVSYRDVVKKVLPAVVSIESRGKPVTNRMTRRGGGMPSPFFDDPRIPDEMRRQLERMMPEMQPGGPGRGGRDNRDDDEQMPGEGGPMVMGTGSGVLVDAKGVVLTNAHVVDGASEVLVVLEDGRKVVSKDIKVDPKTDLAIVRLDSAKGPYPFVALGNSDQMEIGDRVLAVGAPFGMAGTVTHGIISAKNRSLDVNMYEDFLQTDAAINPGNSGGPLVNVEGEVIGINSAIRSRSGGFQGIGLAIPSNLANSVKEQLVKNGSVRRGYIGVSIQTVKDPDLAAKLGLKENNGALVTSVMPKAPASKAGLQTGDVILSVGGSPVKDSKSLQAAIAHSPPGTDVPFAILRDGKNLTLAVRVEEQPANFGLVRGGQPLEDEAAPESAQQSPLGLGVTELTPNAAKRFGFSPNTQGVVVSKVDPNSAAAAAGIRPGMLVTHVERKPVGDVESFDKVVSGLSKGQQVLLQLRTPEGNGVFVVVKLAN
jgi:serine protease Do